VAGGGDQNCGDKEDGTISPDRRGHILYQKGEASRLLDCTTLN
jgi:hypothetical protein